MNIIISGLLAVTPGCWDCIGLTNNEIKQLMAYDDYDDSAGLPNCDRGDGTPNVGASGSPPSDSNPDGPGVHG